MGNKGVSGDGMDVRKWSAVNIEHVSINVLQSQGKSRFYTKKTESGDPGLLELACGPGAILVARRSHR